jgi:hypothetical protein
MSQQSMDKPPAKTKPSAKQGETPDDRRARLLQLAADYLSAFRREPNEESLEMWQLLLAMSSSPDRRRKLAQYERQLASKAARTDPKHPDKFWRKAWVCLIPDLVAAGDDDSAVARLLIGVLPAWLQAKCPDYPTNEAELERAVAAVVKDDSFTAELTKGRNQGPWNPLLAARAVLRGCGMSKDDAKSLLRHSQWEEWVGTFLDAEHGAT